MILSVKFALTFHNFLVVPVAETVGTAKFYTLKR
jgi:hypothetical protein